MLSRPWEAQGVNVLANVFIISPLVLKMSVVELPEENLSQNESVDDVDGTSDKKRKRPKAKRGSHMTPQKMAAQYPDDLEVNKDGKMWCVHCRVPVQHKEKSYAASHLKSDSHKRMKIEPTNGLIPWGMR